ncbi:MAG: OmpA family protein [Flavobacteriales bacterium]|nr:OmpA family protein [Flavobacteriales bacterium]
MRKVLYYNILALLLLAILSGCGYKHYLNSGKEDYNNLKFASAKDNFNTALQKRPESYESLKMLALTLQKLRDYDGAEQAYKLAMNYPQVTLEDKFNYAKMLMSNDKYERAEDLFKEYLVTNPEDEIAQTLLQSCQFIELFRDDTSKYKIKPLPLLDNISMFSPVFYEDGLVYTGERTKAGKKNPWTGLGYNDIYLLKKNGGEWSDLGKLAPVFNSAYHDGPVSFDQNGDYAVFTRSHTSNEGKKRQSNEENVNHLFLFSAEKSDGEWKNVMSLPFNSDDYSNVHPSLSPSGDTLFFASDMPGGEGGFDIYRSIKQSDSWTTPVNLGPAVNTPGNELFPTITSSEDLYFSSDGHPTLGSLDIFKTEIEDGEWRKPRNLNYPINSSADDFSVILMAQDSMGYFTSNRDGVDRIYELQRKPSGVVSIDGLVLGQDSMPLEGALVKLIDNKTGDVIVEVVTGPDGKFDFELLSDRVYKIESSKDGYFTESYVRSTVSQYEDEVEKVTFNMKELIVTDPNSEYGSDGVYKVDNIYYDFNKHNIRADAAKELDKLVKLLNDNPTISIELHSHTDARGDDKYNQRLSDRRAKSAKAYLVQRGIAASRLSSKGFGESRIINECKNDVECSDEKHEENRRTEFIVTKK